MTYSFMRICKIALFVLGLWAVPMLAHAACSSPSGVEADMIYNSSTSEMQFCNGTTWKTLGISGAPTKTAGRCKLEPEKHGTQVGGADSIYTDGTYVYQGDNGGNLSAYSWTPGGAYAAVHLADATGETTGTIPVIWGDGTYIYIADSEDLTNNYIRAYSFNGTAFTLRGSYDFGSSKRVSSIFTQGGYIFVANESGRLRAMSFNGTTFTLIATSTATIGDIYDVWGDGTYIYAAGATGLQAFTFNGTTLTSVGTYTGDTDFTWGFQTIWSDGTYIYAGFRHIGAFTFNGTTFTRVGFQQWMEEGDFARLIVGDGNFIYTCLGQQMQMAWSFAPATGFKFEGWIYRGGQYCGPMQVKNGYLFMSGWDAEGTWAELCVP